jgi:hypothetical protein
VVELQHPPVIEHGSTSRGRWLRANRIKLALGIAVLEGLLVAVDVIPWWAAVAVAGCLIVLYLMFGRTSGSDTIRQASWVAAASQLLVVLVPVLVAIVGTLSLIAVALLAVIALIFLFSDRS